MPALILFAAVFAIALTYHRLSPDPANTGRAAAAVLGVDVAISVGAAVVTTGAVWIFANGYSL